MDISSFNQVIGEDESENIQEVLDEGEYKLDFTEIIENVFFGEKLLDFEYLFNYFKNILITAFNECVKLLISFIVIALLQAFLLNLSESFKSKGIASLSTYIVYSAFIAIVINSINTAIIIALDYLDFASNFTLALIPAYMSILTFTLKITTATTIAPVLFFLVRVIINFYSKVFINIIYIFAVLNLINLLSEKDFLKNFIDIGLKGIKTIIKYTTIFFMAIISLIGIGTPITSNILTKTGQYALKSVPVIGNTIGSAVDTMLSLGEASTKVFVFAIVFISIVILLSYIIKIFILNLIFYISSFLITTIGDTKIINALNRSTAFFELIISICVSTAIMFTYCIIILLFI
ncbi:MAG: stage III sporulation protein AE [Lachnospirales bacterium]